VYGESDIKVSERRTILECSLDYLVGILRGTCMVNNHDQCGPIRVKKERWVLTPTAIIVRCVCSMPPSDKCIGSNGAILQQIGVTF
jgi:hypothetical protein